MSRDWSCLGTRLPSRLACVAVSEKLNGACVDSQNIAELSSQVKLMSIASWQTPMEWQDQVVLGLRGTISREAASWAYNSNMGAVHSLLLPSGGVYTMYVKHKWIALLRYLSHPFGIL